MGDFMGTRGVTLTEAQLQEIKHFEVNPIAREILQNSKDPAVRALVDPNPTTAMQAAQKLIRQSFTIRKV